jgi:hypothetical protein
MRTSLLRTCAARIALAALCTLGAATLSAQQRPVSFLLERSAVGADADRPLSNSAIDLLVRHDSLWAGGGKGIDLSTDHGATWRHVGQEQPFDMEDISAMDGHGPTIWIGLAGSERIDNVSLPKGLGLASSTDNGLTWTRIGQPMEPAGSTVDTIQYGVSKIPALAITTAINNITYDVAITRDAVWTANFAGGLRKSTDGGKTFQPVVLPPDNLDAISPDDTLHFELSPVNRPDLGLRESLNHRVFSVYASSDQEIWVGTAGGVNRSTDGGVSWRKFTFDNQAAPISGNFVVALGENTVGGLPVLWASTINATKPTEFRAVSYTTDRGSTWRTALRGEFTHNFGFKDAVAYAATTSGIFRSDDGGTSWMNFSRFVDNTTHQVAADPTCYAAASMGDEVWVASADGLMRTIDNAAQFFGSAWTILRASSPVSSPTSAYAYPNPFSPDDEPCRIHYRVGSSGSVTVEVFDYAMLPVRTVIRNAARTPGAEMDEIWNGMNDNGSRAANGVYYIRVQCGDDTAWTKVIVLQ